MFIIAVLSNEKLADAMCDYPSQQNHKWWARDFDLSGLLKKPWVSETIWTGRQRLSHQVFYCTGFHGKKHIAQCMPLYFTRKLLMQIYRTMQYKV